MKKSVLAVIIFVWAWLFWGGYGLMAQFVDFGSGAVYTFGVVVGVGLFYTGVLIYKYNQRY